MVDESKPKQQQPKPGPLTEERKDYTRQHPPAQDEKPPVNVTDTMAPPTKPPKVT